MLYYHACVGMAAKKKKGMTERKGGARECVIVGGLEKKERLAMATVLNGETSSDEKRRAWQCDGGQETLLTGAGMKQQWPVNDGAVGWDGGVYLRYGRGR